MIPNVAGDAFLQPIEIEFFFFLPLTSFPSSRDRALGKSVEDRPVVIFKNFKVLKNV